MQFGTTFTIVFTAASAMIPAVFASCTYSVYDSIGKMVVEDKDLPTNRRDYYTIGKKKYTFYFKENCDFDYSKPPLPRCWHVSGIPKGLYDQVQGMEQPCPAQ